MFMKVANGDWSDVTFVGITITRYIPQKISIIFDNIQYMCTVLPEMSAYTILLLNNDYCLIDTNKESYIYIKI